MIQIDGVGYITIKEYAVSSSRSVAMVKWLIARGRLSSIKELHMRLIPVDSVVLPSVNPVGRPKISNVL